MTLQQLTIPIDNSHTRVFEVTKILGQNGIDIFALNIADTGQLGKLRLLVSNIDLARKILMEIRVPAQIDDVIAIQIDEGLMAFSELSKRCFNKEVTICYCYSFSCQIMGKTTMIIQFSDNDRVVEILKQNGVQHLDINSFKTYKTAA